ncbi:putative reverse transcriptase domain-containing protein [Tanacetum coccineum]
MPEDTPKPAQEGAVEVIEGAQREHRRRIIGAESVVTILIERVAEKMPNTRSGASRTCEAVNEQSDRRVAEALRVRDAIRNHRPLMGDEVEQEEVGGNGNGGNRDGGNGNGGNKDEGHRNGGNGDGGNGNGGDRNGGNGNGGNGNGVVGLTRWFEKMETILHISNCPEKYQVKYALYTLLNSALTWWNSHKRTIRNEAAYAMSWAELMKLMTEELIFLCTRMVPNEEDRVERFIGGLPDNIQGNGYAARSAESKRRMDSNPRDNRGQQPPFKRQNISGQNVVRSYTTGNNKRRGYTRYHPLCNKCKYHHGVVCYECGRPGHFRKDFPKLRNQNRGNQTRNRDGNKTGNQTGGNEDTTKAYAIGGGGTNPDSNIVTGTFLLNNCYAFMLFDSGADRSFVSSTFSALLDITPSTLDTSYAIEFADRKFSEINVFLRGCTSGFVGILDFMRQNE